MAMNYWQMFGELKMGVDIMPLTDPESVSHTKIPGYIPEYWLEIAEGMGQAINGEWVRDNTVTDIVEIVEKAHALLNPCRVMEDGYPIMEVF